MEVPTFLVRLFGWRTTGTPNCSDAGSRPSVRIATRMMANLGLDENAPGPAGEPGPQLEAGVASFLEGELSQHQRALEWKVSRNRVVTDFDQYSHLSRLQTIINEDKTNTLGVEIGRDYLVKPDVTVGLDTSRGEFLHAAVSCKWTLRSDRAQNVRHEAIILTRHRRGRQPHIVAVTAEPMPTRIAALARGTGEIDAVYHVALDALTNAIDDVGTVEQQSVLRELVGQDRLFDLRTLPGVLLL